MIRTHVRSAAPAVRFGTLGVAAVLVLGGCSGSGDDSGAEAAENPSSSAPSTGSASPTETASPKPAPTTTPTASALVYKPATAEGPAENVPLPVMPEIAKEESKEGLEAFAEYWFGLVNYGYETGDTSRIRELSSPGCELCESFYVDMEKGYAGEDWIEGGNLTLVARGTQFIKTPQNRYQIILSIKQESIANRGPNGVVYWEAPADKESTAQIMETSFTFDQWVVDLVEDI